MKNSLPMKIKPRKQEHPIKILVQLHYGKNYYWLGQDSRKPKEVSHLATLKLKGTALEVKVTS